MLNEQGGCSPLCWCTLTLRLWGHKAAGSVLPRHFLFYAHKSSITSGNKIKIINESVPFLASFAKSGLINQRYVKTTSK
jgi:hypothetical protein